MKTIQLNENQGKQLMSILDLAVKAGGLNVSVIALPIAQTIEEQLNKEEEKTT